ncbi:ubx2 [[Candida] subhashii]|uniref:Ubx2 n=1 Tax=[Candida] subhashii TaxID=561895 RepID=A0A8J5UVN2_9ASCO|nr:ubx2 [[Candida] subhashii]KAG7662330.1 ubx2 [[Candida] subhashii]
MDEQIPTFLAVTGIEDESIAKQFLELTNGDLEYAVTLFMESGQSATTKPTTTSSGGGLSNTAEDDEELARKLQQEAYATNTEDDVREADTNIHRHEMLIDPSAGFFHPGQFQNRPVDVFGSRRQGVFHQRQTFGSDEDDEFLGHDEEEDVAHGHYYDANDANEDDDDMNISDDDNTVPILPRNRRSRIHQTRESELTSTQRRLANLFRPPFDLMTMTNLDQAKQLAKTSNKWILINIQDSGEFQCQVMNRDFWSNERIKSIVKDNFIFLQYQSDSNNGETYVNFYHADQFPHLAILDPLTGERMKKWQDGQVPIVNDWIKDVQDFLDQFSLSPDSTNPLVSHEPRIDPDSLSEEQQIELALRRSMQGKQGASADDAIVLDESDENEDDAPEVPSSPEPEAIAAAPQDPFDAIKPVNHEEPTSQPFTRVQIRFPNGKRLVRKLQPSDHVIIIYEWLKWVLETQSAEYGLESNDRFNLSNSSDKSFKFIDSLDLSIEEANLKNASILLEKD